MIGFHLEVGEVIAWEARPAPRCFTFRHWRHSIFGVIFLVICSAWQVLGLDVAREFAMPWLAWLPLPFVAIGGYFAFGHLLQARLEWNNVHYAITDRRLLVARGLLKPRQESMPLAEITYFRLDRQGEELGTLRVHRGSAQQLVLHCIEYPQRATALLEAAMRQGAQHADLRPGSPGS